MYVYIYIYICSLSQALEVLCNFYAVKKGQNGAFVGMVSEHAFAQRFLEGPVEERKVMEVKAEKNNLLEEGDCILLVSARAGVLAVLEFESCVQISEGSFNRFFGCHRMTAAEFQTFKASLPHGWNKKVHGYQFALKHALSEPVFPTTEISGDWVDIPAQTQVVSATAVAKKVVTAESKPNHQKKRPESSETAKPSQAPQKFRRMSTASTQLSLPDPAKPSQGLQKLESMSSNSVSEPVKGEEINTDDEDEECEEPGDKDGAGNMIVEEEYDCVLLHACEWNAFVDEKTDSFLRPFATRASSLMLLHRSSEGHQLLGQMVVKKCVQFDGQNDVVWESLYGSKRLQSMMKCKNMWIWVAGDLDLLEKPQLVRFLDVAPRFRNRTFTLKKDILFEKQGVVPKIMRYDQTAAFFVRQLPREHKRKLADLIARMARGGARIRIGTTCSGTDICIPVLKQTLQCLLNWQAGGYIYMQKIYIYIYIHHIYIWYNPCIQIWQKYL